MAFTKKQQDQFFFHNKCPYCGSEDFRHSQYDRDNLRVKERSLFCDTCEQEWIEVYDFAARQGYLKDVAGNAEEFLQQGVCGRNRRNVVIGEMVAKYRDVLEETSDEDLLGDRLAEEREYAIERRVDDFREDLESSDDEDLLGDQLEELREEVIEEMAAKYRDELKAKPDAELFGESN